MSAGNDDYGRPDAPPSVDTFVLDRTENPHPRMLSRALEVRRRVGRNRRSAVVIADYWEGYLDAMCDATGESRDAIHAWLDRMEGR